MTNVEDKQKILLVDDDLLVLKTLALLLKKQDYEVTSAENAQVALEKFETMTADLILSDIRMPGMNGVEMAKEMQRRSREKSKACPPILFITGFAEDQNLEEAGKIGAADFLLKPFDVGVLLETVRRCVAKE